MIKFNYFNIKIAENRLTIRYHRDKIIRPRSAFTNLAYDFLSIRKEFVNEKDVMDTENDVSFLLSVNSDDGTAAIDKSFYFRIDKSV